MAKEGVKIFFSSHVMSASAHSGLHLFPCLIFIMYGEVLLPLYTYTGQRNYFVSCMSLPFLGSVECTQVVGL